MGFKRFFIDLDDGPVYDPGQDISGSVKIFCDEQGDELEALVVHVSGVVGTHAKLEGNVSSLQVEQITFLSQEVLFEEKVQLLPKGQNKLETENTYMFSVPAPKRELPANLTGHHGRVYYRVVARAERASPNENVEVAQDIYFHGKTDLSKDPDNAIPPQPLVKEKTLTTCLCCGQGSIGFHLSIDKTGYLPGEEIICTLNLHNNNKAKAARKLHVVLSSVVTYIIKDKNVYDGKSHTNHDGPTIDPQETVEALKIVISIPTEIPPSGLKRCKLIDIGYMLEVNMTNMETGKTELTGSMPIVIGTCREG